VKLKDRTVDLVSEVKKDLARVQRTRRRNIEKLREWNSAATHDTNLLLRDELTEKSSKYKYADKRIYEIKIPDHLRRVLT